MISPVRDAFGWAVVESVDSTQRLAADHLRANEEVGGVIALTQTAGVGRFGRPWHSPKGASLSMTLILRDYADHPNPHFVGMGVALAAAGALRCQLSWPNDLMIGGKKLGGILTEMVIDGEGRRVPLVGIGVNLSVDAFPPEIADRATSFHTEFGHSPEAGEIARRIVAQLEHVPEPTDWTQLAPVWQVYDRTPGKRYRLADGRESVAIGIGGDGRLLCAVEGETHAVMAAEALFG